MTAANRQLLCTVRDICSPGDSFNPVSIGAYSYNPVVIVTTPNTNAGGPAIAIDWKTGAHSNVPLWSPAHSVVVSAFTSTSRDGGESAPPAICWCSSSGLRDGLDAAGSLGTAYSELWGIRHVLLCNERTRPAFIQRSVSSGKLDPTTSGVSDNPERDAGVPHTAAYAAVGAALPPSDTPAWQQIIRYERSKGMTWGYAAVVVAGVGGTPDPTFSMVSDADELDAVKIVHPTNSVPAVDSMSAFSVAAATAVRIPRVSGLAFDPFAAEPESVIFFSSPDGVYALDLVRNEIRVITREITNPTALAATPSGWLIVATQTPDSLFAVEPDTREVVAIRLVGAAGAVRVANFSVIDSAVFRPLKESTREAGSTHEVLICDCSGHAIRCMTLPRQLCTPPVGNEQLHHYLTAFDAWHLPSPLCRIVAAYTTDRVVT